MTTTLVDQETGKTYEVDEYGNIIDPNKRKFGPSDPRQDPRGQRKVSLSEFAKENEPSSAAKTDTLRDYTGGASKTKSYVPEGYNPGGSSPTTGTSVNAPSSTNAPKASGYNPNYANMGVSAAAGAYGLNDAYTNRQNLGTGQGIAQHTATGAQVGSNFGPWGAGIGAVVGAAVGSGYLPHPQRRQEQEQKTSQSLGLGKYGLDVLFPYESIYFSALPIDISESRTKVEEEKRKQLAERGITVPISEIAPNGKEWELNQAFAASRNEGDLTGKDIINAADFYAAIPEYSSLSEEDKISLAQEALNQGVITEHHGTIDVNFADNPAFVAWVEQMMRAQKDPYKEVSYAEAYPMEYAAMEQARKQQAASQAMSILNSSGGYNNPFSGNAISLNNQYLG